MLYECSGQIKELKNDIHNACANSYVRIQKNERHIELLLSDFPNHVRKGMIYYKHYKDEIDELVSSNSQYTFTGDQVLKSIALQQELADKIGINMQSLSKIERGVNYPTFDTLEKIMALL